MKLVSGSEHTHFVSHCKVDNFKGSGHILNFALYQYSVKFLSGNHILHWPVLQL